MLLCVAVWILMMLSGATIGSALLAATGDAAFVHFGDRMITAIWLGLLTMGVTLLALSVVMPLRPAVSFGLLAILVMAALWLKFVRRDIAHSPKHVTGSVALSFGILALIAAADSTRLVKVYDTGLYHYQFIRWLSEYGTIRGLALLQARFGFSSSWFALAAPFDFGPFQGRVTGVLSGLATLLCLVHLSLALVRIFQRRAVSADWFLAGGYTLVLLTCFAWEFEVSLSPDLPVWILTLLIGWLILLAQESAASKGETSPAVYSSILPLMLALGATTVKLSAAPMVGFAGLFYWFNSIAKWSTRLVSSLLAGLILIPVAAANFESTGCPLYPNSILCVNVPWGVGKVAAKQMTKDIAEWGRWYGATPAGATAWNWILPWFSHPENLLMMLFCGACLLVFGIMRGWRRDESLLYVLALALGGTGFVFVTAPNARFGMGYFALYPALAFAGIGLRLRVSGYLRPVASPRLNRPDLLASILVGMACVVGIQGILGELMLRRRVQEVRGQKTELKDIHLPADYALLQRLLVPPALAKSTGDLILVKNRRGDLPYVLELTTRSYNGIEYRLPVGAGDQCWGAAMPCLPIPPTGDIHLRDPNDGFRSGFTRSAISP